MDTMLYDDDIVTWSEHQAAALRALSAKPELSNAVDWANVIEEIESLGRSQISAVERKLTLVLVHLLKKLSAPDAPPVHFWRSEITTFQTAARKGYTRSMRQRIDWDDLWSTARRQAAADLVAYGDALVSGLPEALPLGPEELVARDFDVDIALERLARSLAEAPSSRQIS